MESVLEALNKYLWIIIIGTYGFLFTWIFKKQGDTYTKDETKDLIDMKLTPVIQSLDRHTEQLRASTSAHEKTNDSLQQLHKDFAVLVALWQQKEDNRDK